MEEARRNTIGTNNDKSSHDVSQHEVQSKESVDPNTLSPNNVSLNPLNLITEAEAKEEEEDSILVTNSEVRLEERKQPIEHIVMRQSILSASDVEEQILSEAVLSDESEDETPGVQMDQLVSQKAPKPSTKYDRKMKKANTKELQKMLNNSLEC